MSQEYLNIPIKYPPGSITLMDPIEKVVMTRDGKAELFDQLFGPQFIENYHDGYMVLHDLMVEVNILRKIVKEMMRRDRLQITSPGEYHRSVTSLAHKIHEQPDVLRMMFEPYLKELFAQMLEPPKKDRSHKSDHRHPRPQRGS